MVQTVHIQMEQDASPRNKITVRAVGTPEGITFCSTSVAGGAFIARPGDTLVFEIEPQWALDDMLPHHRQFDGPNREYLSHFTMRVLKITEDGK